MKKYLIIIVCSLVLSGCFNTISNLPNNQNDDPPTDIDIDDPNDPSAEITLNFNLSPQLAEKSSVIMLVDPSDQSKTKYYRVTEGDNSITIPSMENALINFLDIPQAQAFDTSERSISGAISTLGNIEIISNGLDCLPLSESIDEEIDLGNIVENIDGIASDIEDIYSEFDLIDNTLDSFAQVDDLTIVKGNPDINRNNIVDSQEDFQWSFYSYNEFYYNTANIRYEPFPELIQPIELSEFGYFFNTKLQMLSLSTFGHLLNLPNNNDNINLINGELFTRYYRVEASFYPWHFFYFSIPKPASRAIPYEGDFSIGIEATPTYNFFINGVNYISSIDNFNKLYVPVLDIMINEDRLITDFSISWYVVDEHGQILKVIDQSEIKLFYENFSIIFYEEGVEASAPLKVILTSNKYNTEWKIVKNWGGDTSALNLYTYNFDTTGAELDYQHWGIYFYEDFEKDISIYQVALDNNWIINMELNDISGNKYVFNYDTAIKSLNNLNPPSFSISSWNIESNPVTCSSVNIVSDFIILTDGTNLHSKKIVEEQGGWEQSISIPVNNPDIYSIDEKVVVLNDSPSASDELEIYTSIIDDTGKIDSWNLIGSQPNEILGSYYSFPKTKYAFNDTNAYLFHSYSDDRRQAYESDNYSIWRAPITNGNVGAWIKLNEFSNSLYGYIKDVFVDNNRIYILHHGTMKDNLPIITYFEINQGGYLSECIVVAPPPILNISEHIDSAKIFITEDIFYFISRSNSEIYDENQFIYASTIGSDGSLSSWKLIEKTIIEEIQSPILLLTVMGSQLYYFEDESIKNGILFQ